MINNNFDGSDLAFAQDNDIRFISDGHKYLLSDNTELTPVSRVVHFYFKEFDAEYWAKRKSAQFNLSVEHILDNWELNRERASETGTFMHSQIEGYYNGDKGMDTLYHFSYHSDYNDREEDISIVDEIDYFRKFDADYKLKPFRTEWVVFDRKIKVAGTIDLLARNDDETFDIYDWKRSKSLIDNYGDVIKENKFHDTGINGLEKVPDTAYWHYVIQQNLYRYLLQTNYGIKVRAMHLVVLHPDNKRYHVIDVPECDGLIERIVKDLLIMQGRNNLPF